MIERSSDRRNLRLGPDRAPYNGGNLLDNLLLFGRVCKALGMDVTPNSMIDVARALHLIDLANKQDFYHTLRALIVTRQRDLVLFDEAFRAFWRKPEEEWLTLDLSALGQQRRTKSPPNSPLETIVEEANNGAGLPPDPTSLVVIPTYSQQEILRTKDFADMTGEEVAQAKQVIERLRFGLGLRRTRRLSPGNGSALDRRRAFRRNMRYAGEMLDFPTRAPKIKPRPLVLICDISGSMERYTRLLLHFMHTLAQTDFQVESFVFGTRLTRITRALRHKSVDLTLREVGAKVQDWGGGTRIGDSLHDFNYRWGRRVLGRGAVALLITDGWDRGDPALLATEAARLQRSTYRLIWLNPLIGVPQYEPLTRGAQALLPYADDFLPIRNLASLEMLARDLGAVAWRRPERTAHAHLIVK